MLRPQPAGACTLHNSSRASSRCARHAASLPMPARTRTVKCMSNVQQAARTVQKGQSATTTAPMQAAQPAQQQQLMHKVVVPETPQLFQPFEPQSFKDRPSSSSSNQRPTSSSPDAATLIDAGLQNWVDTYQMPDEMSIWDDDGAHFSTRQDISLAYLPPSSDLPGFASAVGFIFAWACMFKHAIWGYDLAAPFSLPHLLDGLFTFASLEFLSTGMFITTHDSMHGAVTPSNRFLNDVLGAVCVSLYAWFDYSLMWTKHWEHHNRCGTPYEDPDFHKGDPALLPWFLSFMKGYISIPQFIKLQATVLFLVWRGAALPNLLLFWAGAGLVSAVRLFYFGTYIPHKPRKGAGEVMAWAKTRSARAPALLSFLQCYNFNMHWEHHRWPFAPWWDLPRARAVRYQAMGSLDD